MPLEAMTSEQILSVIDLATAEYGTVFVDLPANWTNWSMSLLARSDLILMVTELRVPSLHRARRQLDLLASQDMGELDVRVILNRPRRDCSGRLVRPTRSGYYAGPYRSPSPTTMRR
jgi:pilus assembly protein CpaE